MQKSMLAVVLAATLPLAALGSCERRICASGGSDGWHQRGHEKSPGRGRGFQDFKFGRDQYFATTAPPPQLKRQTSELRTVWSYFLES